VLYCRQKLLKQYHTRRKSCARCRRAKTRCSEVTPQCARCKAKRLECVYDDGHPKDSSLQLQGLEEDRSRRDAGIGPAGSTTDQVSLPGHLWQMSKIESRDFSCEGDIYRNTRISPVTTLYNPLIDSGHEEDPEVDFQLTSLTSSHDYSLDPSLHYEIDFPWAPQHQDKDNCFGADRLLEHTAQDMYSSARQLAESYCPLGPSQIVGQLESQIRYTPSAPLNSTTTKTTYTCF
jgi:hypothetical protein